MSPSEVATLPLHDATVESIDVAWAKVQCVLRLRAVTKPNTYAEPCILEFRGLKHLRLSKEQPWGPSVSINGATFTNGAISIEMQSGDTIEIIASEMQFGAA